MTMQQIVDIATILHNKVYEAKVKLSKINMEANDRQDRDWELFHEAQIEAATEQLQEKLALYKAFRDKFQIELAEFTAQAFQNKLNCRRLK